MTVSENLKHIQLEIRKAEHAFQRAPQSVRLLAVSKGQSHEKIEQAFRAGQSDFGESYLQEALTKIKHFAAYPLTWHFIGRIQSNKIRDIAAHFDWVHSIDRFNIAERLNRHREAYGKPIHVFLQVNLSEEPTKSGVLLKEVLPLAERLVTLPYLKLRGLMAIPAMSESFEEQRAIYDPLCAKQQELIEKGLPLDMLSIGMSQDFKAAIAAGSHLVRIGRAFFSQPQ